MENTVSFQFDGDFLYPTYSKRPLDPRVLQHLAYDPKDSPERYPWKHASADDDLRNRAVASPTSVSDFDQSFVQFKIDYNPFRPNNAQDPPAKSALSRVNSEISRKSSSRKARTHESPATLYSPTFPEEELEGDATPLNTPPRKLPPVKADRPSKPHKMERQRDRIVSIQPVQSFADFDMFKEGLEEEADHHDPDPFSRSGSEASAILNPLDPRLAKLRLYVDEYRDSTFSQIMQDLQGNPHVKKLDIRRHSEKERVRSPDEIVLLFDTIRTMPNLDLLHLHNFESSDLDHFSDILDEAPASLKTLKVQLHELNV